MAATHSPRILSTAPTSIVGAVATSLDQKIQPLKYPHTASSLIFRSPEGKETKYNVEHLRKKATESSQSIFRDILNGVQLSDDCTLVRSTLGDDMSSHPKVTQEQYTQFLTERDKHRQEALFTLDGELQPWIKSFIPEDHRSKVSKFIFGFIKLISQSSDEKSSFRQALNRQLFGVGKEEKDQQDFWDLIKANFPGPLAAYFVPNAADLIAQPFSKKPSDDKEQKSDLKESGKEKETHDKVKEVSEENHFYLIIAKLFELNAQKIIDFRDKLNNLFLNCSSTKTHNKPDSAAFIEKAKSNLKILEKYFQFILENPELSGYLSELQKILNYLEKVINDPHGNILLLTKTEKDITNSFELLKFKNNKKKAEELILRLDGELIKRKELESLCEKAKNYIELTSSNIIYNDHLAAFIETANSYLDSPSVPSILASLIDKLDRESVYLAQKPKVLPASLFTQAGEENLAKVKRAIKGDQIGDISRLNNTGTVVPGLMPLYVYPQTDLRTSVLLDANIVSEKQEMNALEEIQCLQKEGNPISFVTEEGHLNDLFGQIFPPSLHQPLCDALINLYAIAYEQTMEGDHFHSGITSLLGTELKEAREKWSDLRIRDTLITGGFMQVLEQGFSQSPTGLPVTEFRSRIGMLMNTQSRLIQLYGEAVEGLTKANFEESKDPEVIKLTNTFTGKKSVQEIEECFTSILKSPQNFYLIPWLTNKANQAKEAFFQLNECLLDKIKYLIKCQTALNLLKNQIPMFEGVDLIHRDFSNVLKAFDEMVQINPGSVSNSQLNSLLTGIQHATNQISSSSQHKLKIDDIRMDSAKAAHSLSLDLLSFSKKPRLSDSQLRRDLSEVATKFVYEPAIDEANSCKSIKDIANLSNMTQANLQTALMINQPRLERVPKLLSLAKKSSGHSNNWKKIAGGLMLLAGIGCCIGAFLGGGPVAFAVGAYTIKAAYLYGASAVVLSAVGTATLVSGRQKGFSQSLSVFSKFSSARIKQHDLEIKRDQAEQKKEESKEFKEGGDITSSPKAVGDSTFVKTTHPSTPDPSTTEGKRLGKQT